MCSRACEPLACMWESVRARTCARACAHCTFRIGRGVLFCGAGSDFCGCLRAGRGLADARSAHGLTGNGAHARGHMYSWPWNLEAFSPCNWQLVGRPARRGELETNRTRTHRADAYIYPSGMDIRLRAPLRPLCSPAGRRMLGGGGADVVRRSVRIRVYARNSELSSEESRERGACGSESARG